MVHWVSFLAGIAAPQTTMSAGNTIARRRGDVDDCERPHEFTSRSPEENITIRSRKRRFVSACAYPKNVASFAGNGSVV